ncbi:MAG: cytochrome P460 family protein [Planctomycetota bacterium]|nr:cytochrome P460 family protein [Planctomycetota bacterium]
MKSNWTRWTALSIGLAGLGVSAWIALGAFQPSAAQEPKVVRVKPKPAPIAPRYNDNGELLLPEGFENWVFVGSNLGLEYKEPVAVDKKEPEPDSKKPADLRNFHNVYIDPAAFDHFQRTGEFPDKTMLVLDIYKAERGDPKSLVAEGLFPGEQQEVAVAVKNSARPDGSKSNWAYYDFPLGTKAAKAFPDKACYQCHLEHGTVDNVFVQFYPTLRKLKKP